MSRRVPEVRDVWSRARQPLSMLLVGTALMAPASGRLLDRQGAGAAADGSAGVVEPALTDELTAAVREEGVVARLWRDAALTRERERISADLAAHFEVPLTLAQQITEAALEEEIEPRLAFGLVRTESAFERTAVSYAGAVGLTQLLPSTARWMDPGTNRSELFNTHTNLRIGFRYLRYLLDKYEGDTRLALTAYNRGPGTVDRLLRRGRDPENGYATKVLSRRKGRRI